MLACGRSQPAALVALLSKPLRPVNKRVNCRAKTPVFPRPLIVATNCAVQHVKSKLRVLDDPKKRGTPLVTLDLTSSTLFAADFYVRHNMRRLEHLASLGIALHGKSVLEPGAGVGDHTLFYLDRGCRVTAIEPRSDNCTIFREKIAASLTPNPENVTLIEAPVEKVGELTESFDIVHCYGLLYHLSDPRAAIAMLAERCHDVMIVETCVSMDEGAALNPINEPDENPAQALDGKGSRPTRSYIWTALQDVMPHVYVPKTQPAHDEFPTDWTKPWNNYSGLTRAVFVASRRPIQDNPVLSTTLLENHEVSA